MPGSLPLTTPPVGVVLPFALASAFAQTITWPVVPSGPYADGRVQQRVDGIVSRRSWLLTRRLTYTEWGLLKDFYAARKGPLEPFYCYFTKAEHDPTGVSTAGRYLVRFEGGLSAEYQMSRHVASLQLIEVS